MGNSLLEWKVIRLKEVKISVQDELEHLQGATSSDLVALAYMERNEGHIKWRYIVGNLNDRYKQIHQRPGRGLAGLVYRIGRMLVVDAATPNVQTERKHYPIMLAENLYTALAVPVTIHGDHYGVLLIGRREADHIYNEEEIQVTSTTAHILSSILQPHEKNS